MANSLQVDHPDAASSLREGLDETITILKLDIPGLLQKSLRSTNAIESGFSVAAKNMKNVKNWKNGTMYSAGSLLRCWTLNVVLVVSRVIVP